MDGSVDALLAQAVRHYLAGEWPQAVPLFQQVLAHDPGNPIANHQLGLIAFQGGEAALATRLIELAVASDPSDAEYRNNLGVTLNAQGRLAEARASFERAVSLK